MILPSHLQISGIEAFSNFHQAEVTTLGLQVAGQADIHCERQVDSNSDITGDTESWKNDSTCEGKKLTPK